MRAIVASRHRALPCCGSRASRALYQVAASERLPSDHCKLAAPSSASLHFGSARAARSSSSRASRPSLSRASFTRAWGCEGDSCKARSRFTFASAGPPADDEPICTVASLVYQSGFLGSSFTSCCKALSWHPSSPSTEAAAASPFHAATLPLSEATASSQALSASLVCPRLCLSSARLICRAAASSAGANLAVCCMTRIASTVRPCLSSSCP
mmetsp:Transcript_27948/g.80038  ORF Transcript_27948/g.80038 Transcript_27948/m.80038 type:complete len:212 (+) Transcript_27948:1960-2595(+)